MRIACIHLPSFPLQVLLRSAPHVRGAAVAVVGSSTTGAIGAHRGAAPVVIACSRAARAAGVAIGMTALQARAMLPDLIVAPSDAAAERAVVRAVAEALLGVAAQVDAGGRLSPGGAHHALYAEVPARTRGATFGARVKDVLAVMGLTGRVGIADDRFTAWVAASHLQHDASVVDDGVVSVPRGSSAAFLSHLPLALLALGPEVRHMLELLGVRTLGEFAALPPPSVARPWDADYQALARGDGGAALTGFVPTGAIAERVDVGGGAGIGAALATAVARVAARLGGRGCAASELVVRVGGDASDREVVVALAQASAAASDLADELGPAVSAVEPAHGAPTWIEVEVRAVAGATPGLAVGSVDDGVVAAPMTTEESARMAAASAPFRLEHPGLPAPVSFTSAVPREPHRRTRRGKERPRAIPSAQSRLFARLD